MKTKSIISANIDTDLVKQLQGKTKGTRSATADPKATTSGKEEKPKPPKSNDGTEVVSKRSRGDRKLEESTLKGEDQKKIITEFIDKDPAIKPTKKRNSEFTSTFLILPVTNW